MLASQGKLTMPLVSEKSIHSVFLCIVVAILVRLYFLPGYSYSPDSFDYFGLSRTFFGDGVFYQSSTIRSYLDLDHSAAFPLFYPACLALLNQIFDVSYLNAAYFNVALMIATYIVLFKVAMSLHYHGVLGALVALTIVLFPGYIQEVLSGRAIPLALMLLSGGVFLYLRNYVYWAFFLLGLACITRFDVLPVALFLSIYVAFTRRNIAVLFVLFLGMVPWVIYSIVHFGSLWASDNSWLALSSRPGFVTDFPAAASHSIFTHPFEWLGRVAGNVFHTIFIFGLAAGTNFLLLILMAYFFVRKSYLKIAYKNYLFLFLIINAALSPMYLSGYFDIRYFYFAVLILCMFLYCIEAQNIRNIHVALLIFPALILPSWYIFGPLLEFNSNIAKIERRYDDIQLLESLHVKEKNTTYFVHDRKGALAVGPMYGALTGNKIGYKPRNLTDEKISAFNLFVGPNRDINLSEYQLLQSVLK